MCNSLNAMSSSGKQGTMSSRPTTTKPSKANGPESIAEDVAQPHVHASIQKLVESVGVEEHEPQVVDMIVDFIYSYTTDVLRDAQAFGDAAGQAQGKVNLADVELAIHSRADMSFAQAPNFEALHANSERVNSQALPDIINAPGLPLPPSNTLLTANAQFRRDGDDPATIAGSAVSMEAAVPVPVPSGVPLPAGAPEVRFEPTGAPAADTAPPDEADQVPVVAPVPVVHLADDIGAIATAAEPQASQPDEADVIDDVPFVPPP